jgi:hypothetical protein
MGLPVGARPFSRCHLPPYINFFRTNSKKTQKESGMGVCREIVAATFHMFRIPPVNLSSKHTANSRTANVPSTLAGAAGAFIRIISFPATNALFESDAQTTAPLSERNPATESAALSRLAILIGG